MADRDTVCLAAGSGPTFGIDDLACAAATTLGCWADEGLDVRWTPVHGGVAAINAVCDGSVDVSYGGLGPLIRCRSGGNPVRAFVSMARGLAQNLVTRIGIESTDDLAGAAWAIDGTNALSHHMARLVVRALGIDEERISWRVAGPPPERIALLLEGEVDASLIRVEEAAFLELSHGDRIHCLLDSAALGELVPVQPHGVLGARESFISQRPDTVAGLVCGLLRASRALNDEFSTFRGVYEAHMTVEIPEDQLRAIWKWEHDSGAFAVNGEMTETHWARQLTLYGELYPDLPAVTQDDILVREPLLEALKALGRHGAVFDRT